jgi:carbon-monoxide dehydrogenase medium subunit
MLMATLMGDARSPGDFFVDYAAPRTVDEAIRLLIDAGRSASRVLAGGTDLIVQMGAGLRRPDRIVDIKNIAELKEIVEQDGGFRIGAAVPGATIAEHAGLRAKWPGVVEAIELIGSMQVQSRATPVGNLCNASPAADSVPAMIAAGATATVVGPNGRRDMPIELIPVAPGRTSLLPAEFIASINLPRRPPRSGDAYVRFTPRTEMDIAVVGVGVSLSLDPTGRCSAARVAIGAVAPTALLVDEAAAALIGSSFEEAALDRAAAAVRAACRPIDDKRGTAAFRIRISGVMFKRAVAAAFARARG